MMVSLLCVPGLACAADLPLAVTSLRQAGPLKIDIRTHTGREVHLEWDTFYPTQIAGNRLSTDQMEALDTVRIEAPEKFELLEHLYPQQIAEYWLRTNVQSVPAASVENEQRTVVMEIPPSSVNVEGRSKPDPLLVRRPNRTDPDFSSPEKLNVFFALRQQYSPLRSIALSVVGDTLSIGGKVITETLRADAAAAKKSPEQYVDACYERARLALAQQQSDPLGDPRCAAAMLAFLKDPRLAAFTTQEKEHAFRRIFGCDLRRVAEEAEQRAAEMDKVESVPRLSQLQ